jgi:hypothetical protein
MQRRRSGFAGKATELLHELQLRQRLSRQKHIGLSSLIGRMTEFKHAAGKDTVMWHLERLLDANETDRNTPVAIDDHSLNDPVHALPSSKVELKPIRQANYRI